MPRVKLTPGRIASLSLKDGVKQAFLWDSDTRPLAVRVTAGAKSFIFQARLSGKDIRITIGSVDVWDISEAREKARFYQTLIDQGKDPRIENAKATATDKEAELAARDRARRETTTVAEVWSSYLVHHEKRWSARHLADHRNLSQAGGSRKRRGDGLTVRGVLWPLLEMRMVDINAKELAQWQAREAIIRANNARQGFEAFRAFWRWCASRAEYADLIDARAVEDKDLRAEVPSRKNKKFDVLERAHLSSWFTAVRGLSNPIISAYLQGLLLTGCRREELAALRWTDVDFKWGSIWVKDKVAAEGRKIPLTPYLAGLLADLPRRNEWVFSSPTSANGRVTEPRIPHNRALSVAGLNHVTLHGLRRTFASLAEWVEMPRGITAQIMGHAPNATAEKHYINRPLELLAVWHGKYESWILHQAGIEHGTEDSIGLRVVA